MDVFAGFHGRVLAAVQQLKHDGVVPPGASIEGITLGSPKDASHGDLATNAAMVLAKQAGLAPRALVVGRPGGPAFRPSELARLTHLTGIIATVLTDA